MTRSEIIAKPEDETPRATNRRGPGRPTLSNEELLDTALDLFLDKGYERTSIDAITAAAGMAKRTVYSRYGDKTKLFKAALTRAIEQWIVPVERLREVETDDLGGTLRHVGQILVANALSPMGLRLMRLTNAESLHMPEISTFSVQHGTQPTHDYLVTLFRQRLDCSGAEANDAAQAFLNLVVGGPASNAAWGMAIDPGEIDRHIEYSVNLFLNGLLSSVGGCGRDDAGRLRELLDEASAQLDEARSRLGQAGKLSGNQE